MSLFSWLFGNPPPPDGPRGYSALHPLLSSGAADTRALLESLRCPAGHSFRHQRTGSRPGRCPDRRGHRGGAPKGECIVDEYRLECSGGEHACVLYVDARHPRRPEPQPPESLSLATPEKPHRSRTVMLHYQDGRPAWSLRTVQPSRFRDVPYEMHLRLFRMPQGALLGILLNLYDVPDQPYFIHRVLDLSDPSVSRYLSACVEHRGLLAVFEAVGEEAGFQREIEIDPELLASALREGAEHNASIQADGEQALESFLNVFNPVSRERGVEPAWEEVLRRCR